MALSFPYGTNPLMGVRWTDPLTGLPVNPSVVRLRLRNPNGGVSGPWTFGVDPNLENPEAGHFRRRYGVACAIPGDWWFEWEAAGTYIGREVSVFTIRGSRFYP